MGYKYELIKGSKNSLGSLSKTFEKDVSLVSRVGKIISAVFNVALLTISSPFLLYAYGLTALKRRAARRDYKIKREKIKEINAKLKSASIKGSNNIPSIKKDKTSQFSAKKSISKASNQNKNIR